MYARSTTTHDGGIIIPENYDGTAFSESEPEAKRPAPEKSIRVLGAASTDTKFSPPGAPDPKISEESVSTSADVKSDGFLSGFLSRIPYLSGIFKGGFINEIGGVRLPRIGTEEILIIGLAMFLLFAKNGDKECAIMMILLLFINN